MSGLFCHHLHSFPWHPWAWNLPSDLSSHHVAPPPTPCTQFSFSEGEKEPLGVEPFGFTWDSGPRSVASLARLGLHGLPVTGLHGS